MKGVIVIPLQKVEGKPWPAMPYTFVVEYCLTVGYRVLQIVIKAFEDNTFHLIDYYDGLWLC